MNLLILDAGHNEKVAGKQSPCGTFKEWIFNNDMQYKIKKRAEDHGIFVYLTNPSPKGKDEIGLHKRCDLANHFYISKNKPKTLFVSIHANAYKNVFNSARGTETYIASNASQNSKNAAKYIQDEIFKCMKNIDVAAKDRGIKVSNFTVIYKTIMPCLLLEYGFYTNKDDLRILKNNQDELVEATMKGICKYFGIEYMPPKKEEKDIIAEGNKHFKVQIGAFKNKTYAEDRLKEAKSKGLEACIVYE